MKIKVSPEVRFWRFVTIGGPNECWLWNGAVEKSGYGRFAVSHRKMRGAHAFALELSTGEPANGRWTLHSCDVRACVNPGHLRYGDGFDNMRDARDRGRLAIGARQGHAKLTADNVAEIRSLYGKERGVALARRFNVLPQTISMIQRGKNWAWL